MLFLYMPENAIKPYLCNVKTYQNSYPLSNVHKFICYRTYTYQIIIKLLPIAFVKKLMKH